MSRCVTSSRSARDFHHQLSAWATIRPCYGASGWSSTSSCGRRSCRRARTATRPRLCGSDHPALGVPGPQPTIRPPDVERRRHPGHLVPPHRRRRPGRLLRGRAVGPRRLRPRLRPSGPGALDLGGGRCRRSCSQGRQPRHDPCSARTNAPERPVEEPAREGVPSPRTGGVALLHAGHAEDLHEDFYGARAADDALTGDPDNPRDLAAEDLVRGYRLDVLAGGAWRSLVQRHVSYRPGRDPAEALEVDEEGSRPAGRHRRRSTGRRPRGTPTGRCTPTRRWSPGTAGAWPCRSRGA